MQTTFYKEKKEKNYSVIDNTFLRDIRLSAKAKWIFAYLLSLPEDWEIYISEITTHFTDWEASINSWIKELEVLWYFRREKVRWVWGKFDWFKYYIIENPLAKPISPEGDFPQTDNPGLDNQVLLNTNIPNTNKLNIIDVPFWDEYLDKCLSVNEEKNKKLASKNKESLNNENLNSDILNNNIIEYPPVNEEIIYEYFLKAFPNKKWSARKLSLERIKVLLKTYSKEQLILSIDNYKKSKQDTINKKEWQFIKTCDTFFGYEKWSKVRFIERFLENTHSVNEKEIVKTVDLKETDWMNSNDYKI